MFDESKFLFKGLNAGSIAYGDTFNTWNPTIDTNPINIVPFSQPANTVPAPNTIPAPNTVPALNTDCVPVVPSSAIVPLPASILAAAPLDGPCAPPSVCVDLSPATTESPSYQDTIEPTCATHAIKDQNWKQAMLEDFEALNKNVARYKARLVAKGFVQRPGVDFTETFFQVVKHVTIRLILSIAVTNRWSLKQMDVNNVFLQGNDSNFLADFSQALASQLSLKYLNQLHYFLGIEVFQTSQGLFLSQSKYIADILSKANMSGAKKCTFPLSTSTTLTLHNGTAAVDDNEFRKIIGSLQYLTLTRPDICYAVNKLSQFMHKPTTLHLQALKRVLRYLKGTIQHGFFISPTAKPTITVYTDSDWAGNIDNRKSTSAYIIYYGKTPISWCSKKQKTVARSSTEAEYRAIAMSVSELTWI
ncbi:Reverse transcriptase, RNA-dependent DNA polymerase [Corchorus capsularis]|uniref:Reverse transcriptase, RNA-dependent DNA polymerase n=1 Tax=Corchorus capsularis TaxID=210143 RepID=A0A1R3KW15_COCAP|nr:Reverse transcriptase, RNA-dependent DNA polymerase [Corchorus capsularis]